MKITDVKTYVVGNPYPHHGGRNWIFLKITTDDGIEGFGESWGVPFRPKTVVKLIEDVGEWFVIGSDPFRIERLWRLLYNGGSGQHPDVTKISVISAFEMACWDIIGKALNQPIYNLLGGQYHDKLRSYTYLFEAPGDTVDRLIVQSTPELAAKRAAEYVKLGFTAVKLDPMRNLLSPWDPRELSLETLDNAEAVIKSVREAVGSKCDILLGTHGQMPTHSAIRLAKRLEKYDPLWFEEPVPPENMDETARVAHYTTIPIATGERLSTVFEFSRLLEKRAVAILQFALGRVGGILEAKTIAGMAKAHYAQIAPHLYAGPIEAAADIQIGTCSPNFLIQESIERFDGFYAEILKEPIKWEEGYIIPPNKPGLGVELNEEVVAKHPYLELETGTWFW